MVKIFTYVIDQNVDRNFTFRKFIFRYIKITYDC